MFSNSLDILRVLIRSKVIWHSFIIQNLFMKKSGFINLSDFLQKLHWVLWPVQVLLSFLSTLAGVFLWTCSRWRSLCAKAVCWIITSGLTWCRGWGSYRNHCIPLSCFSSSYSDCIPLAHTCASPSLQQDSFSFPSYVLKTANRLCCASSVWEVVNRELEWVSTLWSRAAAILIIIYKWVFFNFWVITLKLFI